MLKLTDDWLTTTEAGKLVERSTDSVRVAINEGKLEGTNERGHWYVERAAVIAWDKRTQRYDRPRSKPGWERSADALAEFGPATVDELALLVQVHVGNVRKHLQILANLGRAERCADGQWALTVRSEQGAA